MFKKDLLYFGFQTLLVDRSLEDEIREETVTLQIRGLATRLLFLVLKNAQLRRRVVLDAHAANSAVTRLTLLMYPLRYTRNSCSLHGDQVRGREGLCGVGWG